MVFQSNSYTTGLLMMLFFTVALYVPFTSNAQELEYLENQSQSRTATKEKQLEGLTGKVDLVELIRQTDSSLTLRIQHSGFAKAFARVKAYGGNEQPFQVIPGFKRLSGNSTDVVIRSKNQSNFNTQFIEVIIVNGIFRMKGLSHIYKYNKEWRYHADPSDPAIAQSRIVTLELQPIGAARSEFRN